jgi:hypothetical protein
MRPVGYSTGAIAPGNVPLAIARLARTGARAVELSALRVAELDPLLLQLETLDLSAFEYVSVHAPSRYDASDEARIAESLAARVPPRFPIVLHPDTIRDPGAWRPLGARLSIENMDKRKPVGRTLRELERVFAALSEASFCFDVGHAHQIDRTMTDAFFLIDRLGPRLAQVHVSEVTARGRHDPLSRGAIAAFRKIARALPSGVPLIVESPASGGDLAAQMELAREALPDDGTC